VIGRTLFPNIPAHTVQQALCQIGLEGHIQRKKLMLNRQTVKKQQTWAETVRHWTMKQWKLVWYLDEAPMMLVPSPGGLHYCRRCTGKAFVPQNVQGTKKYGGGKIMVWGCVSWEGVGWICWIEGKMNAEMYVGILQDHLLPSLEDRSSPTQLFGRASWTGQECKM
jgi:hypothetical protein